MIHPTKLVQILSSLAVLGSTLTFFQYAPTTLAKHGARSSDHDHHRHLAARRSVAQAVRRRTGSKTNLIKRGADGSKCRVKGQAYTPPSVSTSTSATSDSTTSTTSITTQSTTVWSSPPPTSTVPPSSSPLPTSSAASGPKFGLAWPNGNWAGSSDSNYIGNYIGSKTSWYYTWSPFSVSSGDSLGIEFVPMLWGPNQVSDWWGQQGHWPNTVKNAFFFNEPNEQSQSNIAAGASVQYWMNDYLPLRNKGIALGSAATTNAPSGVQWVMDSISACKQYGNAAADCQPDFAVCHWYSTQVSDMQNYLWNYHQTTGLKIWVTEYACQSYSNLPQCSNGDTWYLHQTMAEWMDSQDYILRYSPFGAMENLQGVNQDNALMNPWGSITDLGNWYIWNS
ncbi:hypothetical protein TREMEDRAFT_38998 [Tremella mesenterica DSM 1558]|uniref:uncharacterized protein n=1 Tax=Tremella mesenterica (strain ATCC 24925 / CBS 8224 / DSM 1558 / NBRC 9311 / NRRL Y-6157 / RJB 2259-6 / UBC 559-6) TaxID=578456 RepID=UPI0003F4A496|nr:uncharacterized protein TREMEDRAFT_38998 [Tremella mesenterica DSM 1558]EIW69392.1 hypothetical protein TREMEDRAFT_38998 [Tremella mesenterica DSM 1558]